jgi:hypothetical protein
MPPADVKTAAEAPQECIDWPDYDKDELFRYNKVINEPDFFPLHFVRILSWLNGIEPAWTLLDFDSFNALHDELSANNQAIRLEPNLTSKEIADSAVTANALLLPPTSTRNRGTETDGHWQPDSRRGAGDVWAHHFVKFNVQVEGADIRH